MNTCDLHLLARGLAGYLALLDRAQPGGPTTPDEAEALALAGELAGRLTIEIASHPINQTVIDATGLAYRLHACIDAALDANQAASPSDLDDKTRARLLERSIWLQMTAEDLASDLVALFEVEAPITSHRERPAHTPNRKTAPCRSGSSIEMQGA